MINMLLNEMVTVWKRSSRDAYGQYSYNSPVAIMAKYQDKNELIINSDGQEKRARSVIYTNSDTELSLDDKVISGVSVDLTPPSSADNIIAVEKIKSIDNSETLVKIWV